ncbi:acylneuraminate cytidylyltransferase family protein [bacterium]|nr:acylneuraminate cytidylyltransferase family protein [bacterium]
MYILGIIPARGGSKGVPRKNIRLLCGKPLIWYSIEACKRSTTLSNFVLSTEDSEIKEISESFETTVIDRPTSLALDDTPSLPVIKHAIERVEEELQKLVDAVCIVQPTAPLRQHGDIDKAIEMYRDKNVDSVVSVTRVPHHYHPAWTFYTDLDGLLIRAVDDDSQIPTRRQNLPVSYIRNGAVYVSSRDTIMAQSRILGEKICPYEMPEPRSINIDTAKDWIAAEDAIRISSLTI